MRIAMIGAGYVGLVSGACFSDFGHDLTCVDKDAGKIEALKRGVMPIFELGVDRLVERNVQGGRLSFTTDLPSGVADTDAIFIAVGTPFRRGGGHADLSYVLARPKEIACALKQPAVAVTQWTVPIGTGDEVESIIRGTAPEAQAWFVSNPEIPARRRGDRGLQAPQPDSRRHGGLASRGDHARDLPPALPQQGPLIFTSRRTPS